LLEGWKAIRMARSTFVEGLTAIHLAKVRFKNAEADQGVPGAFREAELGSPDDPGAAARIKATPGRSPVVAALD
jgi:hypothetical protein